MEPRSPLVRWLIGDLAGYAMSLGVGLSLSAVYYGAVILYGP